MRRTFQLLIVALASLLLVSAAASADGDGNGYRSLGGHWHHKAKTASTQDLLVAATKLDRFVIATGELAQQQGGSDAIRSLGATLVQDHTALQQQVDALAARLGVTLPEGLDPWSQRWVDKLAGRSGAAFDWKFVKTQLWVHEKALHGALWAAVRADTPEGRELAQGALPVLARHLAALYDIAFVADDDAPVDGSSHDEWGHDHDDEDDDDRWEHRGKRGWGHHGHHGHHRGHGARHGKRR